MDFLKGMLRPLAISVLVALIAGVAYLVGFGSGYGAGVMNAPRAAAAQVPPLDFEYEVLVLPRGAQRARGMPSAVNHALPHAPGLRRWDVDVDGHAWESGGVHVVPG